MKIVKDVTLVALGMGAVLAYQKYSKPVIKKMKKAIQKTAKNTCKELEDMME